MLKNLQNAVVKSLSIFDNPIVHCLFVTFVALYASILAPRLPNSIGQIMSKPVAKVIFFFIVVLLAQKDPRVALVVSLGYIFTIQAVTKFNVQDKISSLTASATRWSPAINPSSAADNVTDVSLVDSENESYILDKPYKITDETEVVAPLHDVDFHAGAQSLGQPIVGYENDTLDKNGAPW